MAEKEKEEKAKKRPSKKKEEEGQQAAGACVYLPCLVWLALAVTAEDTVEFSSAEESGAGEK